MEGAENTVENAIIVLPQPEPELPEHLAVAVAVVVAEEEPENAGGVAPAEVPKAAGFSSGGEDEFRAKRKRGRPRKQPGMGVEEARPELLAGPEYSETPTKRGRGRPRGSGKWQTLAASVGSLGDSAGTDFTPYIISVQEGENIVQKIWTFSQKIPDSLCILSASGTISSAEIFVPASPGPIIRYEGQFSIVYLNGSHTLDEKRGGKICLLSVQLANPEGRFYGGAVAGTLIAGGPTQLIIATFKQKVIRQHQPPLIKALKVSKGHAPPPPVTVAIPPPAPVIVEAKVEEADQESKGVVVAMEEDSAPSEPTTVRCDDSPPPIPPPLPVDWKVFGPMIEPGPERETSPGPDDAGVSGE